MNLWQRARRRFAQMIAPVEGRGSGVFIGSHAGVSMHHELALTFPAMFAAVKIVAESIGVLKAEVFERQGAREVIVRDMPLSTVLSEAWNEWTAPGVAMEVATGHAVLRGTGYAEIARSGAQRIEGLYLMRPDWVKPRVLNNRPAFEYKPPGGQSVFYDASDLLVLKGFGGDGIVGYDTVSYMARPLSAAVAADQLAGSFFKNGAHIGTLIKSKRPLKTEAKNNLKAGFAEFYTGPEKSFRTMFLEEGLEIEKLSISPVEAQLLESRKYNLTQVATFTRVPPPLLGDLDKATFSNIESLALQFLTFTLLPWVTRWEQEMTLKFFPANLRGRYVVRMNTEALHLADFKGKIEALARAIETGIFNPNEARNRLGHNPRDGGDRYRAPLNYGDDSGDTAPTANNSE